MPHLLANQRSALIAAFLQENAVHNLSALRTPEACGIGNVDDSLALLDAPQISALASHQIRLLDIGTGGGFPLLPLAMARQQWQCHGLDSTAKKIAAVGRIADNLSLNNVLLHAGRAEECGHDKSMREQFHIVTARAVAELSTLLEFAAPFANVGGWVALWKSVHAEQEIRLAEKAAKQLGCQVPIVHRYDLGEEWGERLLLLYRKHSASPRRYPRATGIPKKDPLR